MKKKTLLIVALAAALSVVGCKKNEKSVMGSTGTATTTAATSSADPDVLDVNGEKLKKSDLDAAAKELPPQAQSMMETPYGKRALGDELVRMKVLEQEGRRLNVESDPEVARQIAFQKSQILATAALKKLATPNDNELRQKYEQQKAQYDLLQVKQIVIAYKGGQLPSRHGAAPTIEGAVKKAEAVVAKLKAGEPFESVLSQSDDPRVSETHGQMGFLAGAAPPQIAAAMTNLKPGDITPPIRTTIGVHVLQLVGRQAEPFERVKPALEQQMRQERAGQIVEDLRKKAKVKFEESYFGPEPKMPEQPQPAAPTGATQPAVPQPQ